MYRKIKKSSERDLLKKDIEEVRLQIKLAYFKLSQANDLSLIESIVLELKSLEIKHDYLIKRLKKEMEL